MSTHDYYMRIALEEARMAVDEGEVPVGAVAVAGGVVVARAHNSVIKLNDPSAHAEILVLREAGSKLHNYRLSELILYVTIEPCVMCAGAMINARIKQLVFGAYDEKAGAISLFDIFNNRRLNHRIDVIHGVLEHDVSRILKEFFKCKRRH